MTIFCKWCKCRVPNLPQMTGENGKVALRNFLEILANMAREATARKAKIVRKEIEGLLDGSVDPESFSAKMHKEIISNPQPTLVPFTRDDVELLMSLVGSLLTHVTVVTYHSVTQYRSLDLSTLGMPNC